MGDRRLIARVSIEIYGGGGSRGECGGGSGGLVDLSRFVTAAV